MRAPPISSSVVFSPVTISTMRSEPRYIDALPSTIDDDVAERRDVRAAGRARAEQRAHLRDRTRSPGPGVWKILPAPRRPGNRSTWSVIRAPAESTR